jgi:acetyl-CoA carboxylase carboxyl transferase subunit beta
MSGGQLPALSHTDACPGCGLLLVGEELRARTYVCECGHHFRMHGQAWITFLADAGSWREHWSAMPPRDVLNWGPPAAPYRVILSRGREAGLDEAVRTGTATLGGRPLWLAVFDFRFIGGTLSVVAGERLALGLERATQARLPYVLIAASGGARMQEGLLALMQLAKVNAVVGELHSAGVPFFSVLTDPTFGGTTASLALLGDVNIAEPNASIGFSGARVIRQAMHVELPPGFQSADFQLRCGQVDMIVARTELRSMLLRLLDMYWYRRRPKAVQRPA